MFKRSIPIILIVLCVVLTLLFFQDENAWHMPLLIMTLVLIVEWAVMIVLLLVWAVLWYQKHRIIRKWQRALRYPHRRMCLCCRFNLPHSPQEHFQELVSTLVFLEALQPESKPRPLSEQEPSGKKDLV